MAFSLSFWFSQIHTQDPVAESLHPEVLTIFGNWLADTCSESPNVIIDKYMEKVITNDQPSISPNSS